MRFEPKNLQSFLKRFINTQCSIAEVTFSDWKIGSTSWSRRRTTIFEIGPREQSSVLNESYLTYDTRIVYEVIVA